MREFMRAAAIALLVVIVAIDLKEIILDLTSETSVLKPILQWTYSRQFNEEKSYENVKHGRELSEDSISESSDISSSFVDPNKQDDWNRGKIKENPLFDPALQAVRKKLQAVGYTVATSDDQQSSDSLEFNEEEKQQIVTLKEHLTNVMQQWCLPKLVCELHASLSDKQGILTDAERGLLTLIRETSLGTMGEVMSRYHFAAHMGQLLSGVEGNGCNNLYPNCPLSGTKVKEMVKKVRIR